ncbi:hypothetical protein [uncultured Chryseobacterium sp.]|uniref:hypothetical protein n=1 Tax=uncultured Chryseobacterium sp. TaxID=259322 RepID=UPI0025D128A5|nr:hypothetical protein [uncultured Chryseobacterium sp.]
MKFYSIKSGIYWMFLLLFPVQIFSQDLDKYIPFRQGNLWGLCDAGKFIVVQPQYQSISWYDPSVGGFHAEQNRKFGIIDYHSGQVMPFISEQPVFAEGTDYIVFDGFGYYRYSRKTRMRLGEYANPEKFPVRDRWVEDKGFSGTQTGKVPTLTRDDLSSGDLEMLKPYEDETKYRINFKADYIEILSENAHIGIYILKIGKMYRSTPDIAYVGWQVFSGKPYLLTTDSSGLFGLTDEFSHEIYPVKYASILMMDHHHLILLSEPDPADRENVRFKTILANGVTLNGRFEPFGTVSKNGHAFQLYYTMINGVRNYAGEDGTLYFKD